MGKSSESIWTSVTLAVICFLLMAHSAHSIDFDLIKTKYKFCNKMYDYSGTSTMREKECKDYYKLLIDLVDTGDPNAEDELGFMYNVGDSVFVGISKNTNKACDLWDNSAKSGNKQAMWRLGACYQYGTGRLQDYSEAIKLYITSSKLGEASAMERLADLYAEGMGVDQNYRAAYVWYSLSADKTIKLGFSSLAESIQKRRDEMSKHLDVQTILKAQSIAKQCLASDYKDCGY